MSLSIVVPVYNESENINPFIDRILLILTAYQFLICFYGG